jgi:hypothetical protein
MFWQCHLDRSWSKGEDMIDRVVVDPGDPRI